MSRLYALAATATDVADHFGAGGHADIAVPSEMIEACPGLVVREANGRRLLGQMHWGFPRLTREMRLRGEPPGRIGLVADLTNPMWQTLVVETKYRCLIPLTHFANPNGTPGEKTRSWFSLEGQPIMAWAGFCKNTAEFGPVYAGMTMDANDAVMPYNDRMPVLVEPHEYERWLHGTIKDVIGFQFRSPPPSERFIVEHSDDLWRSGKLPPTAQPQTSLL